MRYEAIVLGLSSGGMEAMKKIFPALPKNFSIPLVVVQHVGPQSESLWISILDKSCKLKIKEAEEKEAILGGHIYIAPPNYHLLVEKAKTFSLSIDERVSYARPSIDVLFDSAAEAYREKLVGVVLTGSNHDGAAGLKRIKDCGGLAVVQDPNSAFSSYMPQTALEAASPDHVLDLEGLVGFFNELNDQKIA